MGQGRGVTKVVCVQPGWKIWFVCAWAQYERRADLRMAQVVFVCGGG
jgi:hypothetical protein